MPIALVALVLFTALAPCRAHAEPAPPDSLPVVAPDTTSQAAPDTAQAAPAGTVAASIADSAAIAPADTVSAAPADSALADTASVIPPPPPPRAMLRVETQPSGLSVEIDGTSVGRSPVGPMAVPPGTHRVRAHPADPRRFGTSITETVVTLAEGAESTVHLDVRPPVVIRTNPEPALVTLTGRSASDPLADSWAFWPKDSLLGSTPLSIRPSVIESAYLRFTREAFADTTVAGAAFVTPDPFRVSMRQTSTAASRPGSKGRTPILSKRWFQWTLVGVGSVLTGAAAVWHNEADRTYDEYLASSNVDEIPGLYDRTIDYDRRATASFLVGQACMITGALLLLTGQSH